MLIYSYFEPFGLEAACYSPCGPLDNYSLPQLYALQADIESDLDRLRQQEPRRKRKLAWEYKFWIIHCNNYLEQLVTVRDEIVRRKTASV